MREHLERLGQWMQSGSPGDVALAVLCLCFVLLILMNGVGSAHARLDKIERERAHEAWRKRVGI